MNYNDRQLLAVALVDALLLGSLWSERFVSVRAANRARNAPSTAVQRAPASVPPSAASSYDVPISGSVLDSIGRRLTISGTVHLELAEPAPVPVPPPPSGITFAGVTDIFGNRLTSASAGKVLLLKGTGFPMTSDVPPVSPSSLRLTLAGKTVSVSAWTHTSLEWGLSNTLTDALAAPLAGTFQVWRQNAGVWTLLGQGGSFTILPSPRVAAPRR